MTGFATLTSKNQVTLPADMVALAQLQAGMRFWVTKEDDRLVLEKVGTLDELQGMFADNPIAKKYSLAQITRRARKSRASRIMRYVP